MSSPHDLSTTTLTERVVLLALIECETDDRTPATSNVIRERCADYADRLDTEPLGQIREADVMRSLNGLVGDGIVAESRPDDRSPTGKGRPEYALEGEIDAVLDELASDDRIAPLVGPLRD